MNQRKIICLILALITALSLCACGNSGSNKPVQTEQPSMISADGQWLGKGGCYQLDRLDECDFYMMKGSPEHLIYTNGMELRDADGGRLTDDYVRDYTVTDDGVWYAREQGIVDGQYIRDCYAVKLDFAGNELIRFDLPIMSDSIAVTADALYIYDAMDKAMAVCSLDGGELGRIDLSGAVLEDFSGRLYTGGDGSVWLLSDTQSGMLLYPVALSTMSLGAAYTLPTDTMSLQRGTAEHPFLLATQSELSWLDAASGAAESILFWDECGLYNGELSCFIPDGDGFLCLCVTGMGRLRPAKPEEIRPKTTLTLGTVFNTFGSELAALFNASSNDYCIQVVDYSEGGKLSMEEAQLKLNTELMSGQGPDMVMLADMGFLQTASAFADMYPLLDADPELSREDFFSLKAFENGDRLLVAPSSLAIETFGALPSVAGDRVGWTWDEYFQLESQLPPGGVMSSYLSADYFLTNSLNLYAAHAIDWAKGTCDFDTPEFVRILQAAKAGYDPNCPEENPYFLDEVNAMMADGRMILAQAYFIDAMSFAQNESMNGRELSYVGWPTPDGSCGSVFRVQGIAISAATDSMDGCWQFAKSVLKNTYIYKPTFEKAMTEAMAPKDADANAWDSFTLTQSQVDKYRTLLESITVAAADSSEVSDIVLTEAAAMFAGDKSPEETAKLIQSKLSIYVAEHS